MLKVEILDPDTRHKPVVLERKDSPHFVDVQGVIIHVQLEYDEDEEADGVESWYIRTFDVDDYKRQGLSALSMTKNVVFPEGPTLLFWPTNNVQVTATFV